MRLTKLVFLACVGLTMNIQGQKKTQSVRNQINSPEQELAGFKVPEGFIVELVASERDGIYNPIDLSFDDEGNLWTQTAQMYPLDPVADIKWNDLIDLINDPDAQTHNPHFRRVLDLYEGKEKGIDKILILSNLYNDNPLQTNVWADGLTIPQSILPYKNGAYVAQGSELFFLEDVDGDGKAEKRTRLFTGFGITDSHTMSHVLKRGPGEWIHFSQGALNKGEVTSLISGNKVVLNYSKIARFTLDGENIEVINAGLNNIWGFQLRGNGQWYGTEANDLGYSIVPMEIGASFPGIGGERIRPYQAFMPKLHKFRVGGTGISALAFSDDLSGSFPEKWKDVALLANPITSSINAVRVERRPDGTVKAEHLEDFLSSEDDWFRPVNMEFGPDGCLYIADWYNKIISHNELPTTHPDRDKKHGRIWKIRHVSQTPHKIINFKEVRTRELVAYLQSPSLWEKRAAWHQISDRSIEETKVLAKDLIKLTGDDSLDEATRISALWSLEGIHHFNEELMKELLREDNDDLRRETIRSLASFSLDAKKLAELLNMVTNDANPMVRSQVLRTIEECGVINDGLIQVLINACRPEFGEMDLGGSYERNFERYLARKALEKFPKELHSYLYSKKADKHSASNLLWASQAMDKNLCEDYFIDIWGKLNFSIFDDVSFIIMADMINNDEIYALVKPVLENTKAAENHLEIAVKNQDKVQSDALAELLEVATNHLLSQPLEEQIHLGLEAVAKFEIDNVRSSILNVIRNSTTEETLELSMEALENNIEENTDLFRDFSNNEKLTFNFRILALNSLAKIQFQEVQDELTMWIPSMEENQKKTMVKIISSSREGASILRNLYKESSITEEPFDLSSAERIFKLDKEDSVRKEIIERVKERIEKETLEFDEKLERYMAIAEKKEGNPEKGEELFQTCLMCHRVGNKGQDIAPALDGSGMRENEALLTSLLDPDAALESSYAIYRVAKLDDTIIEGYLVKNEENGVTIAFMGGNQLFIPADEVKTQNYLRGRSFMIKGLIEHYSEEDVSNLLSYIRTLK